MQEELRSWGVLREEVKDDLCLPHFNMGYTCGNAGVTRNAPGFPADYLIFLPSGASCAAATS